MKALRALAAGVLLALGAAAQAAPQAPFAAHYVLSTLGFDVGTAEVIGTPRADGGLRVVARAAGLGIVHALFGELGEARFEIGRRGDESRVERFAIRVEPPFDSHAELDYGWDSGVLQVLYNGSRRRDPLDAATGDPFALMLAIGDARRAGRLPPQHWRVPDDEALRDYAVQMLGEETVSTPFGSLRAERYESVRSDKGRVRIVVWLAPELDWLPVLGTRVRDGREKARFTLTAYSRG